MKRNHQPEPERLVFPAQLSAVKAAGGSLYRTLEGYASVFDVLDSYDDVVRRGAFEKTIKERVPAGRVKLLSGHHWSPEGVMGTVTEAREDARGLFTVSRLSETPAAQDLAKKVDEGHLKWKSIGFSTVREEFVRDGDGKSVRNLLEVKLFEVSVVPFPANEECDITAIKGTVPFQDLPLAPAETGFDPAAARARVLAWATKEGKLSTVAFRRAFAWWDRKNPTDPAGYAIPLADVVDGRLQVVPRALFAAAAAAAKGTGIPGEELPAVRRHLERYLEELREATGDEAARAPWEEACALKHLLCLARAGRATDGDRQDVARLVKALGQDEREALLKQLTAGPPSGAPTEAMDRQARLARARLDLAGADLGG